ncbi:MAG TPA: transposase, partial [Terracidiphilus sp.]|nr:transposase [Terracidiphilus sp.]
FLLDLLEPIGRSERRYWGELYVRGLLQDGDRKSIEPMAARLPDGNVQAMQQFIGQSPWEWQEVWARLGKRMTAELEPDSAWVVDDTGFPKQGEDSVGVERRYCGTLGKTGSCQVAVSLHHAGELGNAVLGWRLYLPETWTKDKERRQAAGIPEEVVFQKKWELALDHRSGQRLGRAGPHRACRCGIRRGNGVSRCAGGAKSPLCGRHLAASRGLEQATQDRGAST